MSTLDRFTYMSVKVRLLSMRMETLNKKKIYNKKTFNSVLESLLIMLEVLFQTISPPSLSN